MLCPTSSLLPPPGSPRGFTFAGQKRSLRAAPAPAPHVPLARVQVSTQSLQARVATVEFDP